MDAAARQFSEAYDARQHPMEFVNSMRKKGELIMGVGHRVKSINNPDMRVTIIKVLVLLFAQAPERFRILFSAIAFRSSYENTFLPHRYSTTHWR